jgi:hypothetical protein
MCKDSDVPSDDRDFWKAWDGDFVSLGWWGIERSAPGDSGNSQADHSSDTTDLDPG